MFKLLWLVAGVTSQQKGSLLESQLDQAFCVEFTYCRCRCGFFFFWVLHYPPTVQKLVCLNLYAPGCVWEWMMCVPCSGCAICPGCVPWFHPMYGCYWNYLILCNKVGMIFLNQVGNGKYFTLWIIKALICGDLSCFHFLFGQFPSFCNTSKFVRNVTLEIGIASALSQSACIQHGRQGW